MEDQHRDWKNLPFEVLYNIFSELPIRHLHVLNLVCKSWFDPAQARLYHTVQLKSLSQLRKFYTTIKKHPSLAEKVKNIFFLLIIGNEVMGRNRTIMAREIDDTMADLLYSRLPYLESCRDACLDTHIPIIDALADSRLTRLKDIDEPIEEITDREGVSNYVTCTLLLKDRLESISIADDFSVPGEMDSEKFYFNRLYSKLHLFKRLKCIHIRKTTKDVIDMLEGIVENHEHLEEILINLKPPYADYELLNNNISMDRISTFTPHPNVKKLINHAQATYNEKTLLYIMHKFPEIREFTSRVGSRRLFCKVNQQTLVQFLQYLFKVNEFHVDGLSVDVDTIGETFENYWETTSSPGSEDVNISFGNLFDESTVLEVSRLKKVSKTRICFDTKCNQKYLDFIKRNGKFIKSITISRTEGGVVPDDILTQVIPLCPYLQNIHMEGCILKEIKLSLEDDQKISLNELSLEKCIMRYDILGGLSCSIKEIKQVRLIYCTEMADPESDDQDSDFEDSDDEEKLENVTVPREFDLQYTKVDSMLIQNDFGPSPCYAKLGLQNGRGDKYYYRFDTDGEKEEIDKEEYDQIDSDNDHFIFEICCLSKPDLIIKC